ncbi:MAG: hypothetical protein H7Z37_18455, partial [Pyrinomonadaceae bacterium]|nr:hypothetical protein [Pyrinomonadaceae bacterium]
MTPRNLTVLVLIYAIWISLFAPFAALNVVAQRRAPRNMNNDSTENGEKGLQFKVREGSPQTEKREVSKFVAGEKLNQNETDSILKRLPQVKAQDDDKADFKLRADSLPPPKTGNVINAKFPANENQNAIDVTNANSKTLEVSRFSPDGNVPIVSDLSVTFSQPMIAVTSQTQAAQNVPV